MVDKEQYRGRITELVDSYNKAVREDKLSQFSEADVGSKFILPLLEALGWDIKNIDEVKEQKRTLTGPADYSLNVRKSPKIIVEIKKFTEDLDSTRVVRGREESFPYQATRYAWHLKVDWCVLSNFKELRLYYAHTVRPEDGLVFKFSYDHYLDSSVLDRLWLLSKESVLSGKLETLEKRRTRSDIDKEILNDLFECRKLLVNSINKNNPKLSNESVRESVQKILDRILIIRVAEDRGVIGSDSAWRELESWQNRGLPTPFMRSLKSLFRDFDEIYNSKLFEPHQCEDLVIDNNVLEHILSDKALYGYNFDLITADVLGAIYEDYIGHILSETEKGEVEIVESRAERKRGGIYYTPTYIVDYIVRNTLGELLKTCKTPDDVSRIKVLDPACGSGSFLIKAFDVIKEWYDEWNRKTMSVRVNSLDNHFSTITDVELRILNENLFGVDLDPQAAEITAVNLMLKALKKGERLPLISGQKIKCGNSLISGLSEELKVYFGKEWERYKPFNWEEEFLDIFMNGGFDVVIGNPPHGAELSEDEREFYGKKYEVSKGYKNSASLFIERSYQLLKEGGFLGLVIPKSLAFSQKWNNVRSFLMDKVQLTTLADISKAFPDVLLEQIVLIFRRTPERKDHYQGVKLYWEEDVESYHMPLSLSVDLDTLPIYIDPLSLRIAEKLLGQPLKFNNVSRTFRGLPVQSKIVEKKNVDHEPLLRGDDIKRYSHISPQVFVSKDYLRTTTKIEEMRSPKIISQRIVAHVLYPKDHIIVMSTLDREGLLNVDTVENTVITDKKYDLRYLLALLNSTLISWFTYNFIFCKAIRTMDFDDYYVGKIPLYAATSKEQEIIGGLVDKAIDLRRKNSDIVDDFERYWEPMVDQVTLRYFYDRLTVGDKKILNRTAKGSIKRVRTEENENWLTFIVDYSITEKGEKKEFPDVPILKCRFDDEAVRKFLLHVVLNYKKQLGTGNISSKILGIPMLRFDRDEAKNREVINKVMDGYLEVIHEKERLEKEIREVEEKIDNEVFKLYDLTDEEVVLVKKASGHLI